MSILKEKSFELAVRIVNLGKYLRGEHKEFVLSNQIVRSGTSVGANVREAQREFLRKCVKGYKLGNLSGKIAASWTAILPQLLTFRFAAVRSMIINTIL